VVCDLVCDKIVNQLSEEKLHNAGIR